ncbi:hypothetical protein OOJ96_14555 [Pseudomonas sp. 15FMM2]|uniref:Uncharacterized protein n=1 Tax=Pseudomonas imrae TaxID=2992837 RepID=A0ACC7PF28_9PSED
MSFLWNLFTPKPVHRHFALLDQQGRCQAFKQCSLPPVGEGWVEVEEIRLSWMHHPLPARARLSHPAPRSLPRQPLAA